MRERDRSTGRPDEFIRPRFLVFENVPGLFSSNKGRDFQTVLTEIVRITEPDAPDVPLPNKGKWPKAGCLYDEVAGWSIAWRLFDSRFWGATLYDDEGNVVQRGTPQRRKRLALVADFGGISAPEILFERKGMYRNSKQGAKTRQEATGNTGDCADPTSDKVTACTAICVGNGQTNNISMKPVANTLDTLKDIQKVLLLGTTMNYYDFQAFGVYGQTGTASTLKQRDYKDATDLITTEKEDTKTIVRKLTPLECERLQGFPDNWTLIGEPNGTKVWKDADGNEYPYEDYVYTDSEGKRKSVSDVNRYMALGNSICLPFWYWLMKRISAQYERPATLGSFFDGIGGFPLCHERINGPGTALFASEIDEFCIAVTKEHFGGEVVKDE